MDFSALAEEAQRTPAQIKAALPIAFVMQEAGFPVVEVDTDGRLHCLCPFHADSAPSFDIFGRRWGCYPCGIRGDVLDLLSRLWNSPEVRFNDLISWAEVLIARMPNEWAAKAGEEYRRREFDPRQALTRIEGGQGISLAFRTIAEHYGWPDPQWLQDRWRVGAEWNQVLIPYYHRDGSLATFKRRGIGTAALSAPGAELCLYGEWLDTDLDLPVILCEGESDTWAADKVLGGTHSVLGVPGAGWVPRRLDSLAPLAGRQTILSFDADEAGRRGMKTWAALLSEVGAIPEEWNLPTGQDIRSYLKG